MHMVFKFAPEADAQTTLKLKVEVNTREHECALVLARIRFPRE